MPGFLLTTIRVLLGLAALAIGLAVAFDQSARKVESEGALAELAGIAADGLPVLQPDEVTDRYDGQFVFVQGRLEPPTLRDPLTGLTLPGVQLERVVELEQWDERIEYEGIRSEIRRKRYVHERVWSEDLIDSDDFEMPLDSNGQPRVNPKAKPFNDDRFIEPEMTLGAWKVSSYAFGYRTPAGAVDEVVLAEADLAADWRTDGIHVYYRPDPTVRLRYEHTPFEAGRYSFVAVPEDGELDLPDELAMVPLIASGNVEAEAIVQAATGRVPGVQIHWIFYTFVGLMLLIRPVAKRFDRFNGFTYAPFGKRLAMTAGIAALITALVGVVLPR